MDRLTVSATPATASKIGGHGKHGTPAHGLLGRYNPDEDDESSRAETESQASEMQTPGMSPLPGGGRLFGARKQTPAPAKFSLGDFEEKEIAVDDEDSIYGAGLGKGRTLFGGRAY
jgi:hypothetical protein